MRRQDFIDKEPDEQVEERVTVVKRIGKSTSIKRSRQAKFATTYDTNRDDEYVAKDDEHFEYSRDGGDSDSETEGDCAGDSDSEVELIARADWHAVGTQPMYHTAGDEGPKDGVQALYDELLECVAQVCFTPNGDRILD